MAIIKPEAMDFSKQTFSMIIYGSPGTGKTTMALSAPKPLLLDFDNGISLVRAEHRKDTSVCDDYEGVLADIASPAMKDYETVVIDTGGSFITFLKDWALRTRPGCKTKDGTFNSMRGFGEVKNEFARFTEQITKTMHKNVIYVFHSVESADKDGNPIQRLMCEGSTKNTVWTPCDFGGYLQMIGNDRYLCFTPEQEYFAKGTHGITGKIKVPELAAGVKNDFITKLFDLARKNIQKESDVFTPKKKQYETVMAQVDAILAAVNDIEGLNAALTTIGSLNHALTSRSEAGKKTNAKGRALGAVYNKAKNAYIPKETKKDAENHANAS